MEWSREASDAVSRAPFFVRKRIRKRVEEEARRQGARAVSLAHVRAAQQKYLQSMEREVKGYRLEACFGQSGCPNRVLDSTSLMDRLKRLLDAKDFLAFLKSRVEGPLKFHHEFRVILADCPNACSRPQIVDIGIIGAQKPTLAEGECTGCGACVEVCQEGAFSLEPGSFIVNWHRERCVYCGQCLAACPSGALQAQVTGYRLLLGGKLGRHPQLGRELPGILDEDQVVRVVERCVDAYMAEPVDRFSRFGEFLNRTDWEKFLPNTLGLT
ncbi:4Fe-4S dicluster domain-containing protein [Desulfacinum hydrothermale DSM 13146]|uniref:4Fe-4S dicluster domain-containing protein n=1 Tax=Desulfacinum hydrothermale DSM 13146 TaxID=1121390 RepID=A0A1W1XT36_9BACT|nr:4Fe-4S dicluster domain-containing protein [Desulfacinum hydrothermale]SMC27047.1 4Fe-4S dicluster domain-containing protein [Desulfacinum hydrothermale DSM 13146]